MQVKRGCQFDSYISVIRTEAITASECLVLSTKVKLLWISLCSKLIITKYMCKSSFIFYVCQPGDICL